MTLGPSAKDGPLGSQGGRWDEEPTAKMWEGADLSEGTQKNTEETSASLML